MSKQSNTAALTTLTDKRTGIKIADDDCLMRLLGTENLEYMEGAKQFMDWIKENNAYYYARPAESFSINEAVREAEEFGASIVIVENMS